MRPSSYPSRAGSNRTTGASPFSKQPPSAKPGFVHRLTRWTLAIVLVALALASLYVSPSPNVVADSDIYHPLSVYETAVTSQIGGISDRSKISFDSDRLILNLKKQFPEISSATVELPLLGSRPVVHLRISQPAYLLTAGAKRFILNTKGVAVVIPPALSGLKLLTIQDQGHYDLASGSQALSSDQLNFISQVVAQCKAAKVTIASLVLPPVAEELDLHPAGNNYYVKFYLGGDPVLEAGQYLAARHHFQASNVQPEQYVDVRVAGKIFYK